MPFDPLLVKDAVRQADDKFYAEHPDFYRRNGKRKARTWCLGVNRKLHAEWYRYYNEAKAALRRPAPVADNDYEDPVEVVSECSNRAIANYCAPISAVRLTSVTFPNRHLLYDEEEKWTYTGQPFRGPDWTPDMEEVRTVRVSVELDQAYALDITYQADDEDACPDTGSIWSFDHAPGNQRVPHHKEEDDLEIWPGTELGEHFASYRRPPALIGRNPDYGPSWAAEVGSRIFDMGRSTNEVCFTWGPAKIGPDEEDGPTVKRLRSSLYAAAPAGSLDEFEVIKWIFSMIPGYTLGLNHLHPTLKAELDADKDLLKSLRDAGWPAYHPEDQVEKGGAWLVDDNRRYLAECQAICRYVRAIMRQLGGDSTLEFKTYTADFSNPFQVLNQHHPTGPNSKRCYAFVDGEVEVDKTYLPTDRVGFNNFEAYLKVMCPGHTKPRIFGGGIGLIDEGRHPLACFKAFVEFEDDMVWYEDESGVEQVVFGKKITAMHAYDENSFNDWDGTLP